MLVSQLGPSCKILVVQFSIVIFRSLSCLSHSGGMHFDRLWYAWSVLHFQVMMGSKFRAYDEAIKTNPCDFSYADVDSITPEIVEEHFRYRQPIILTNVGKHWPAKRKWRPDKLIKTYGHMPARSYEMHGGTIQNGEWLGNETVESIISKSSAQTYAIRYGHPMVQALKKDFETPHALSAIQRLGPILSIGNAKSTVFPHFHVESWLAQVSGRKLWIMADERSGNVKWRKTHMTLNACDISTEIFAGPREKRKYFRCVVKPTEAIFVPRGVWHSTCNLDDGNIAIGYIGGWTDRIHRAAVLGNLNDVNRALGSGADIYHSDSGAQGMTPIHTAAMAGHATLVKALLMRIKGRSQSDLVKATVLQETCTSGHVSVAKVLIEDRADVNWEHSGRVCIIEAVGQGAPDLVKLLIKSRAKFKGEKIHSKSPLPGSPLVAKAAAQGHRELVELLLRDSLKPFKSFSVNSRSGENHTLLHDSVSFPHVAEFVLQQRADASLTDSEGQTALHLAAKSINAYNGRLVELMLNHGVAIDALDNNRSQPLHTAVQGTNYPYVSSLLSHRADPAAPNSEGDSSLALALKAGHWSVVRSLLEHGASVTKDVRKLAADTDAVAKHWLQQLEKGRKTEL